MVLHRIDDLETDMLKPAYNFYVLHRIDDLEILSLTRTTIMSVLHRIDDLENPKTLNISKC